MKSCSNCVNGLTTSHPDRDRCNECLGHAPSLFGIIPPGEIYKHWEEGDPRVRLLELQRSGEINIVIGGEGEHEINAKWSIHEAYKHLANVCNECGGLVTMDSSIQLVLGKTYGPSFVIEWMHGCLYKISIRHHEPWWEASE